MQDTNPAPPRFVGPAGFDAFGSPAEAIVQGVVEIAVLRANKLGDFLLTLPALEALSAAYPAARVTLLGLDWHRDFLGGRPGPVDEVVVLPQIPGLSAPGDVAPEPIDHLVADLQRRRFDLAFQMQGGGRHSNPFVRRLGARVTVGCADTGVEPLDRSLAYDVAQPEALRYLELVSLVGARPLSLQGHVFVLPQDLREAARVVSPARAPLVALHPGAADPTRRWPAERFAALGDRLASAGAQVVVTGAQAETGLAGEVAGRMRQPARVVAGQLSLGGLAGLLSRCALVVGNDTGPLHLARSLGTRTVTVYWCFNALSYGPAGRRLHRVFVSWQTRCPVCGVDRIRSACAHQDSLVADVPVGEVAAASLDLLQGGAS